jgi:GrpB-like predicted nucleotidyltransferase (UPF0157 family)/predicted nucleotidyltransferase
VTPQRQFISSVIEWAGLQSDVLGVALVGSFARGAEQEHSDIDLVIIVRNPAWWLETHEWLERFGGVRTVDLEDYGLLQSRRVRYENGIEVEFGITSDEWLNTAPIDEGTRRVMSDGHRILDDKAGLFAAFLDLLRKDQPNQEEAIHIVPYDSSWPARFQSERKVLAEVLGNWVHGDIHHVGSTAVIGLAAKPVIDIMVGVRNLNEARACIPILDKIGYCYFPYRDYMHWFCKPSPYHRTHHLHLMEPDDPHWQARIAFRDYLRRNPEARAEYEQLKFRLADTFRNDREAYTDGKKEFVESIVLKALGKVPE